MLRFALCIAALANGLAEQAPELEIVDPNPALLSDVGELITPDTPERVDAFAGPLPARSGVVADGVSALVLRIRSSNEVTFSLSRALGMLRPAESRVAGSRRLKAMPHLASDGTSWVFAIYAPPNDLPGASLRSSVSISAEEGAGRGSVVLTIETPPVILVHGVWSDSSTWSGFREFLANHGFRICPSAGCTVNYGTTQPAPSFDPLAVEPENQFALDQLIQATTNTLSELRTEGTAVTQVDVVGHSLGGLIARARVAQQAGERAYRRRDNFGHGDFHKLITLGTPHRGTPVANFLITNREVRSAFFDGATLEEYLATTGRPVGPAIEQMQTNSPALAHLGATEDVPCHAIVGIAPRTSHTEELLNMLPAALGYFLSFDSLLGGNQAHDVLVPRSSQAGGLPRTAVTLVRGVVHADLDGRDTGETESHAIWRRIARLLVASSTSKRFGHFTNAPTNGAAFIDSPIPVTSTADPEH